MDKLATMLLVVSAIKHKQILEYLRKKREQQEEKHKPSSNGSINVRNIANAAHSKQANLAKLESKNVTVKNRNESTEKQVTTMTVLGSQLPSDFFDDSMKHHIPKSKQNENESDSDNTKEKNNNSNKQHFELITSTNNTKKDKNNNEIETDTNELENEKNIIDESTILPSGKTGFVPFAYFFMFFFVSVYFVFVLALDSNILAQTSFFFRWHI